MQMMPKVGSLWFWFGAYYDVIAVRENQIKIRECGSTHEFFQDLIQGVWTPPYTARQAALGRIASCYGSLLALRPSEREFLPPGTHFCPHLGKALVFGKQSCVC